MANVIEEMRRVADVLARHRIGNLAGVVTCFRRGGATHVSFAPDDWCAAMAALRIDPLRWTAYVFRDSVIVEATSCRIEWACVVAIEKLPPAIRDLLDRRALLDRSPPLALPAPCSP